MSKLSFSGHESFVCKQFWLKKGVDFVNRGNSFSSEVAVVDLGVGKNMVRAIGFWLKAFGLVGEDGRINPFGKYIFGNDQLGVEGRDPFLESVGTIWLLHYSLVTTSRASIYDIVFNQYRRYRPEFTLDQFEKYIIRYCKEEGVKQSPATLKRDIRVFLNSYLAPRVGKRTDLEEAFSGLLYELQLLDEVEKVDVVRNQKKKYYSLNAGNRRNLPIEIFFYSIINNKNYSQSISFQELHIGRNSPGSVFALDQESLFNLIQDCTTRFEGVTYSQTAGNRVLQVQKSHFTNPQNILDAYYS